MHGAEETERIKAASAALFGGGDLHALDAGHARRRAAGGRRGRGAARRRAARRSSTCWSPPGSRESRGAARRTVVEGGAYLNNERVADPEHRPRLGDVVAGGWLVLRRGKKSFAGVRLV